MPCAPIRLRTFSSSDPEPHARSSKLSMCARLPVAGSCPSRATISERISDTNRSEEHTSELQSLMRISYAVFCLKKKNYMILYYTNASHTDMLILRIHLYHTQTTRVRTISSTAH